MALIEMEHVTRTFKVKEKKGRFRRGMRTVRAVQDISFNIESGEFVGYLGANGAGKSTTIKMLAGILAPSSGRIRVAGQDPFHHRSTVAYRIGAMFGQRIQLWWDLPLVDSFEQLRYIYNVTEDKYRRRMSSLTEVLDLGPFLSTPVRQLSLGQRIRGELAAAMLHEPELLFLDEPTIGLDIIAKQQVRDFLISINQRDSVTIILTTHDMADLERMCSRLILLSHGEVVSDGAIEQLFVAHRLERTLVVDLAESVPPIMVKGVTAAEADGPRQSLKFRSDQISPTDLIAAIARQAEIVDLTIREPDVEDLVRLLSADTLPGHLNGTRETSGTPDGNIA